MAESLVERSCADFADVLAAKESVPGGGGAAALVGALAAALCNMTGEFTLGKKKYAAYEEDVLRMLAKGDKLRARLLELVDADAAAFEPLSRAYGIPKTDPNRAQVLEEATENACVAPLEMMGAICQVIELLEEMHEKGTVMLQSDVGCGALFAGSALMAAALNVLVNTKTATDRAWAEATEAKVDAMVEEYLPRANAVAEDVTLTIRGRK